MDSNHDSQIQSLESYQLDDPGVVQISLAEPPVIGTPPPQHNFMPTPYTPHLRPLLSPSSCDTCHPGECLCFSTGILRDLLSEAPPPKIIIAPTHRRTTQATPSFPQPSSPRRFANQAKFVIPELPAVVRQATPESAF